MAEKQKLSVLIPTWNEATNIAACIATVSFADEIVVLDSCSTDNTRAIAESMNVIVQQRPFDDFASQKNFGLSLVSHPWVLLLDADERVTPELANEIRDVLGKSPVHNAYSIARETFFAGKKVRCWSGDRVVRLILRSACRFDVNHPVHEELRVEGAIGSLVGRLQHFTFRSFEQYLPKLHLFARLGAETAHKNGKRASMWQVLLIPAGRFLKAYVLRRGFLDGIEGVLIAGLSAYATYLRYALLWELQNAAASRDERTSH